MLSANYVVGQLAKHEALLLSTYLLNLQVIQVAPFEHVSQSVIRLLF